MKITLHIVLYSGDIPLFQKKFDVEITVENLQQFIDGHFFVGKKPNCHEVKFKGIDLDTHTYTLSGKAQMLRPACNGYVKDLLEDGWGKY